MVRHSCFFFVLAYVAILFGQGAFSLSVLAADDVPIAVGNDATLVVPANNNNVSKPDFASRKALVIGVRNYDHLEEIPSGAFDAKTFGQKLESLGFAVVYSIDDESQTVWNKLLQFEASIEPGDVALFYYSGHGFQHNGLNYMTAQDTPTPIPADDLLYVTVPLDDIVARLRGRRPGFSLILIDACRENTSMIRYPDGTSKSIGHDGLASIRTPPPHMVMGFATYFGKTAQSSINPNENSVYTRFLNQYIDREDTEIIDILGRYVGQEVNAAQPGQVPETRLLPAGYFYPKSPTQKELSSFSKL